MGIMGSALAFETDAALGISLNPAVPTSLELYNLFNPFLARWTNLCAQYVATPMEDVSHLPLEQAVYFRSPVEGLLVLRSTLALEKHLVELATGESARRDFHAKGLFMEMTVLFWHFLLLKAWQEDSRALPPARLKSSVPRDWPDRKPDSACTLFIKDFPLEIRLWVAASEEELASWQRKS